MKKSVVLFIIFCLFIFSACTKNTSGNTYELTSSSWQTSLSGGAEVSLSFDDDTACLSISNADSQSQIQGRFIADDTDIVIFDSEIFQNYSFEYLVKNSTVDLSYNGATITLNKIE